MNSNSSLIKQHHGPCRTFLSKTAKKVAVHWHIALIVAVAICGYFNNIYRIMEVCKKVFIPIVIFIRWKTPFGVVMVL